MSEKNFEPDSNEWRTLLRNAARFSNNVNSPNPVDRTRGYLDAALYRASMGLIPGLGRASEAVSNKLKEHGYERTAKGVKATGDFLDQIRLPINAANMLRDYVAAGPTVAEGMLRGAKASRRDAIDAVKNKGIEWFSNIASKLTSDANKRKEYEKKESRSKKKKTRLLGES